MVFCWSFYFIQCEIQHDEYQKKKTLIPRPRVPWLSIGASVFSVLSLQSNMQQHFEKQLIFELWLKLRSLCVCIMFNGLVNSFNQAKTAS